jgi:putative cardiolipin synthase
MQSIFGKPAKQLDLVSPYFVPGESGVDSLTRFAQSGAKVRVLTNSLEATDVAAVHAGYKKRRRALLAGGVTIYELRKRGQTTGRGSGPFGSSGSSLHAKTFAVDGARVFVGSFNFDPRSAALNTEMGVIIDSPSLAARMSQVFETDVPANAYEVRLAKEPYWIERRDGRVIEHHTEPGTTFWKRAAVSVLSVLPIEWLL